MSFQVSLGLALRRISGKKCLQDETGSRTPRRTVEPALELLETRREKPLLPVRFRWAGFSGFLRC